MSPAAFILAAPSMCGPQKCFYFLSKLKFGPYAGSPLLLTLLPSPPHTLPLFLSFSLCVDNVSANDLTALVEAPSSNWTSRDWVLYRKTIVILSQISTTLRFNKTQGWTGLCGLLHSWIEEKNQVCFLLSNGREKKNEKGRGKMGAITLLGACGLKCSLR